MMYLMDSSNYSYEYDSDNPADINHWNQVLLNAKKNNLLPKQATIENIFENEEITQYCLHAYRRDSVKVLLREELETGKEDEFLAKNLNISTRIKLIKEIRDEDDKNRKEWVRNVESWIGWGVFTAITVGITLYWGPADIKAIVNGAKLVGCTLSAIKGIWMVGYKIYEHATEIKASDLYPHKLDSTKRYNLNNL
jgi:hypothetical protein